MGYDHGRLAGSSFDIEPIGHRFISRQLWFNLAWRRSSFVPIKDSTQVFGLTNDLKSKVFITQEKKLILKKVIFVKFERDGPGCISFDLLILIIPLIGHSNVHGQIQVPLKFTFTKNGLGANSPKIAPCAHSPKLAGEPFSNGIWAKLFEESSTSAFYKSEIHFWWKWISVKSV